MVVNKKSKVSKQRGNTTYGFGSMKKNRGAGNRGGRGNAGSGKRGDSKKPSNWDKRVFGKKGFKSKNRKEKILTTNIRDLEEKLNIYLNKKLISKEGEFYIISLEKLGYNKLLSQGNVLNKLKIKVTYASNKAIEKIRNAGGEISGLLIEKVNKKPKDNQSESKEPQKI